MLGPLFLAGFTVVLAQAPPAPAEIYRCTDANGSVTYQQSKCPTSGKSSRVDTQETGRTFDSPAREADWAKAAEEKRVQPGMPRRWVRAALGTPSQMHLGADEGATETWDYDLASGVLRVGFRDGNVLWTRDRRTVKLSPAPGSDGAAAGSTSTQGTFTATSPQALAASLASGTSTSASAVSGAGPAEVRRTDNAGLSSSTAAAMPSAGSSAIAATPAASGASASLGTSPALSSAAPAVLAGAADPARLAERRQNVALGNDCDVVRKELGAADQDNGLGAPSPLALLRGGAGDSRDLVYEPAPGDPGVRTRIRCVAGKVTAVERSHVP